MDARRRKRQTLLLISAILAPAAVLIPLAIRLVRQEAELVEKRAADERRQAVEQLARELSARLETLKLREAAGLREEPFLNVSQRDSNSPIVFVASIEQDQLVLPWEQKRTPARANPDYSRHQREGEAYEFVANDPHSAVESYERALAAARRPSEKCEARLWKGRTLFKDGRADMAGEVYRSMLDYCDLIHDEDGVSFALYAAERLISSKQHVMKAHEYVLQKAQMQRWWPPPQAYLLKSLLSTIPGDDAARASETVSELIRDIEQLLVLALEIRAPVFESPFGSRPGDSAWLAFGDEPWLITVVSPQAFAAPVILGVSSKALAFPEVRLFSRATPSSIPVGRGFTQLHAEWPAGRFTPPSTPVSFYAAGLVLVLSATVLAGYLLLRDVNREVRTMEMRSHFVASVSHELKTPLTAIRMFAETLATSRTNDEGKKAEYLRTIVNESERLSRLVDNVLDFARIEHGKKIYQMSRIRLADVVQSAVRAMQYPLSQQGFNLEISIDSTTPATIGDADALQQALLNLLTNAMKYSGDSRRIDLSLTHDRNFASIDVTDRGLGISREDQKRVFERFYRVRSDQTDFITGAGLGLTLAMNIAEAHGGRLEVRSEEGRGSTFSLRLPLHRL